MQGGVYLLCVLTMFSSIFPINVEFVPNESQGVKISLVGDIMMEGSVRTHINKNGFDYPWEMVKKYFQDDDITIGNLETSITTRGTNWPNKQFNFRSDPRNLKSMKESGIDIVALANNHTLDYGYDGLVDTLNHIDKSGIKRVGGGKDRKEAIQEVVFEKDGMTLGFISVSRVVPDVKWYATNKRPGIIGAYDPHVEEILNKIKQVKDKTDALVVSIHWGKELNTEPRKEEINLAKKMIDAGADIIMGHHPHVLQGIEIYNGKPIFYSLGNFVFGTQKELTSDTMIGQVNFLDGEIKNIEIIPCRIMVGRPVPLLGEERLKKINYMNVISRKFNTKVGNDGIIIINK